MSHRVFVAKDRKLNLLILFMLIFFNNDSKNVIYNYLMYTIK